MSRKTKNRAKILRTQLTAVTGGSTMSETQRTRLDNAAKRQSDPSNGQNLPRGANRWFRWYDRLVTRANASAGTTMHQTAMSSNTMIHIPFKDVIRDFTKGLTPGEQSDDNVVYRREREIVTQCVLFDLPLPSEIELHEWAKHGMPAHLFQMDTDEGPKPVDPVVWMVSSLQSSDLKAQDNRLFSKMSRFYEPYNGLKRIYCRGLDEKQARREVLNELSHHLPKEVFRREAMASFHTYDGEGAPANIPGLASYYSKDYHFSGDKELLKAARDVFLWFFSEIQPEPISAQQAHDRLYVKTKGSTQVGGRIHTSWQNTSDSEYEMILRQSEKGSAYSPFMPVELGNRTVASKHELALDETSTESMRATVDSISVIKAKSRITFASYKAYQIWDLRWVYPLQDHLSSFLPFVALRGHDKTFNTEGEGIEYENARTIKKFLQNPEVSGASWDFSAHDTHQQAALEFLFGQGEWIGEGVFPRIFPTIGEDEWKWAYLRATKSPVYVEGGLLHPSLGSSHGLFSGEGFTNIAESVVGYIMTIYSILRWLKKEGIIRDTANHDTLVSIGEAVRQSSLILVMGDDTVGLLNHRELTSRLDDIVTETPVLPVGVPIEEFVRAYGEMGFVASTDARKISYFTTADSVRMLDFTAHLCYYELSKDTKQFEPVLHGYYPVMRTLCSYFFSERVSGAEELIYAARYDGKRIAYSSLFHERVHQHFALTGFSVLSNMWMNPQVTQEIGVYYALRYTWHAGALSSLIYNPTSVKKMLRSISIRESGIKSLAESKTFHVMVRAYAVICQEYSEGIIKDRHDLEILTEWAQRHHSTPLYTWVKTLSGPASWDWESICGSAIAHLQDRNSKGAREQVEEDSIETLLERSGLSQTIVHSIINALPDVTPEEIGS